MTSDIETRQTWVPALGYKNPNSRGMNFVRFDAINQAEYTVYDAKWSTTGFSKQAHDIRRQVEALRQNPAWKLVVEVPTETVANQAYKAYSKIINEVVAPGHYPPSISIRVVPPGIRDSSRYDSMPMEVMPPRLQVRPMPIPGTPVINAR